MKKKTSAKLVLATLALCSLGVTATPTWAAELIRQIKVEGSQRIEPTTVLSYVDVKAGDSFNPESLDRSVKNLYATGLFADVSLYQEGNDLIIKVAENPIINEIAFEGNSKIKDENLTSELQLKPRTVLTRTKVQADVERLQELYRLSGRFSATVEPKIIKLDQNRVNLVFEINEGPVTYISRIGFVGNKKFSESRLQKVLRSKETSWWRFWSSDDKYDPDRLAYDRELLRQYYLDNGYADFRVESAVAELSPDRKSFYVTFTLDEGARYKVGNVHIHSEVPEVDSALFKHETTFLPGDWYKASEIEATVNKITTALGQKQFAFVEVVPSVERDKDGHKINVTFTIKEGQKVFVENININGNVRTIDEVIRREMKLSEGDPFNLAKMKNSEHDIKDLGFFDKVEVKPVPGSAPDKTNLDVTVEEKSTGEMSLGAGYSTTDGVLGNFSIREKNFLGRGQELQLSSTLSTKRTEFDFSFTEPYFLKKDLSAGIDLFHVTRNLQSQSSYDSRRTGGGLRLGYPLGEHLRQSLNYRYEDNQITNVAAAASNYIKLQAGRRTTSAVSQNLTYDKTDSKLDPTEGYILRLDNEVAGLGGDARYLRNRLGGTYYYPLHKDWILSVLGEGGYIAGLGGEQVRINERFYLGGSNLRGFEDSGIGARDAVTKDALGGNTFWRSSAQVDFPTGLPEELGVRAHVFSDFGALSKIDQKGAGIDDSSAPRIGAGAGLTWHSPMGPVTVDVAHAVKKENFDKTQNFRFSFGTRF